MEVYYTASLVYSSTSNPPLLYFQYYHIITKIARCVDIFNVSLGWFDCTEPSLTTFLKYGVHGAYALIRGYSSASNLLQVASPAPYRSTLAAS